MSDAQPGDAFVRSFVHSLSVWSGRSTKLAPTSVVKLTQLASSLSLSGNALYIPLFCHLDRLFFFFFFFLLLCLCLSP